MARVKLGDIVPKRLRAGGSVVASILVGMERPISRSGVGVAGLIQKEGALSPIAVLFDPLVRC